MSEPPVRTQDTRARVLIAAGLLLVLLVLVVFALPGGSESDHEFAAPPEQCLERWNSSEDALSTGRHNSSSSHDYFRVQVAYTSEDGTTVSPEPFERGSCVVIFAASQLDTEPVAAAEINTGRSWTPLSASVEVARLAELQSIALGEYNAELAQDGTIAAIAGDSS